MTGDLTDPAAVRRAVEGCEVVYHIAATYREAGQADASYTRINVDGTRHVLEAALSAGSTRVVHCSTGGVHGHIENPPADETAPFAPGDVYQRTKLEGERVAADFGRRTKLEVVIVRPIGIYGPGDMRFLKMFRGIARRRFPMLGRGQVFYHLTYIDDLVRGFELAGTSANAPNREYVIAGPEYTTLEELTAVDCRGARRASTSPATSHLAGVDCGSALRGCLRAVRHRAAAVQKASGLLP